MIAATQQINQYQTDNEIDTSKDYGGRAVINITFRNEGAQNVTINNNTVIQPNTAVQFGLPYPYFDCTIYRFVFSGAGAKKLVVAATTVAADNKTKMFHL